MAAAMVAAGATALCDPEHPVMAAISVAEMARRVGVTERTGYAKWDAEDLHIAVIRRALSHDDVDLEFDADELVDAGRAVIDDDSIPPSEAIGLIFDVAWRRLIDDPRQRAAHALWPYCSGDSRVAEGIRQAINEYYEEWIKRLLSILDSFVAKHSRRISVRDEVSRDAMGLIAILVAEGTAFHTRVREGDPSAAFDEGVPRLILQMLFAYAIEFHEDEGLHPFDEYLTRLNPG